MRIVFAFGIWPGHWERLKRKAEKGNTKLRQTVSVFSFSEMDCIS
jgi:hypothetical protein